MARLTDRPPPPPPESPFLRPAPRPQLPPADPAVRQRAWAALTLAVLSLLTMMLMSNVQRGAYVAAVAVIVALVAIAVAVSATSAAKRAGARRPRAAIWGTILGVLGLVLSAFALAAFLIFHTQLDQYANCMNGAITSAEQQSCQTQLNNSIGTEINILGGS
jgi:peptidoglycan/LPS O-acetylase OafA/YrhL